MLSINLGYNLHGGDLSERFGPSGQVGPSFMVKFKSNWIIGVEGVYLFSQDVKKLDYYYYLDNDEGWITNMYGDPGIVAESMSGFNIFLKAGRVFRVFNPNPNSGIMVNLGAGFMQHKIWIEERGNNIPQLTPEYIKGYDRLCNGLLMNQFIGYMWFHKQAKYNFYAGFEFSQGLTQNRRSWDFILEKKVDDERLDLLYSIKIGWVFSFHKRMSTELYFY